MLVTKKMLRLIDPQKSPLTKKRDHIEEPQCKYKLYENILFHRTNNKNKFCLCQYSQGHKYFSSFNQPNFQILFILFQLSHDNIFQWQINTYVRSMQSSYRNYLVNLLHIDTILTLVIDNY